MADEKRKKLEARVRELEEYLESLTRGGAGGHAHPTPRPREQIEQDIAKTRRDIEDLKRQLQSAE